MKRKEVNATGRTQKYDTRCFDTKHGKGKRAKSSSAKRVRQRLQKEDNHDKA